MSVLGVNNPTLLDLAKRQDPDGTIATIIELLAQTNEMLEDMSWMEGNLSTGHRTTVRTGLPKPTWRKMYGGVIPTKSTTAQITDTCGMLEAYSEIDKALADLNGNTSEFRLSESVPHIEGISQEIAETLIYGNEGTEPEAFTGLAPRYNDLSAPNAKNIIDALGTGSSLRSIWLVGWSSNTVHGIVPKGSTAGLQMSDKGEVTVEQAPDGSGGRMQAYRTHFRFDAGLTLRDWRYAVRIANIDMDTLSLIYDGGKFATGPHLPNLMFQAISRLPSRGRNVRMAFYMPLDLITAVQQQVAAAVQNSTLTTEEVGGVTTLRLHGVPLRQVDVMAADEAQIQ